MVRDVRGAMAEADTGAKRFMVGWIWSATQWWGESLRRLEKDPNGESRFRGARGLSSPKSGSRENTAPHHHRVDLVRGQAHLRAD